MTSEKALCAVGFSVHTGWTACVAAGGSLRAPRIEARERLVLLGDAERFVFHRAAEAPRAAAERLIATAERDAGARAEAALADLIARLRGAGHKIAGCAIVAREGAPPAALDDILRAHPRIHMAEGYFYRDVLLAAARAIRIAARVFPPRELEAAAAAALRIPPGEVPELLGVVGRAAGRPWAKDQQQAALAAWTLIASR